MSEKTTSPATVQGISMGVAIAMILSYAKWHSIWWALLHGILSWIYVIYYAIVHN